MRVIVADDQTTPRNVASDIARGIGYEVIAETDDGVGAVELCRQHKPDIVILDVMMRKMNGDIAARKIREEGTATHIVIASNIINGYMQNVAIEVGGHACSKPFKPQQLSKLLLSLKV